MIRQRNALFRQVQEFFHSHLIGLYRWDDARPYRAETVERLPGKRLEAGKTHDKVEMSFGPFNLMVLGPFEDDKHPNGLISVKAGQHSLEGPLDSTTWVRAAVFIKEHNREDTAYASAGGEDWGR